MVTQRLGFACKWIDTPEQVNGIKAKDNAKQYNTGSTTVSWLNRQSKHVAEEKLWSLIKQNTAAMQRLIKKVGALDPQLRMVRLSSDLLPVYTHADWAYFYQSQEVRSFLEKEFSKVGEIARSTDVRLSFHPGQFCVLASETPDIVNRSIEEFEYHTDMARWMGYSKQFQDFKINVHISGRKGPAGIVEVLGRLSPEARNCLTIENDENSWGLDASLELEKHCALVLDIHYHYIRTGEYIEVADGRVKRVIDSWRRVRPVIHYSASREDLLANYCPHTRPDLAALLEQGYKKAKLRAHSDFMWNHALNQWALEHGEWADIMVEAKGKNLASFALYDLRNQIDAA